MSRRLDLICRQAVQLYGSHAVVIVDKRRAAIRVQTAFGVQGVDRRGHNTQDAIERLALTCVPQRREM